MRGFLILFAILSGLILWLFLSTPDAAADPASIVLSLLKG